MVRWRHTKGARQLGWGSEAWEWMGLWFVIVMQGWEWVWEWLRVSVWGWGRDWGRRELLLLKKMRDLGLVIAIYIYIYMGDFCNFRITGLYPSRVSDFFYKTQTCFGFLFKNPYPTLFLIGLGKIRPIRVGPGRVPAGQAKIAIPSFKTMHSSKNSKHCESIISI